VPVVELSPADVVVVGVAFVVVLVEEQRQSSQHDSCLQLAAVVGSVVRGEGPGVERQSILQMKPPLKSQQM